MQESKNFEEYLLTLNLATSGEVAKWREEASKKGVTTFRAILEDPDIDQEKILDAEKEFFKLEFADLEEMNPDPQIAGIIPKDLATNYQVAAYSKEDDGTVNVAVIDPTNLKLFEAVDFWARSGNFKVSYALATKAGLDKFLKTYDSASSEVEEALSFAKEKFRPGEEAESGLKLSDEEFQEVVKSAPVAKMVNVILSHAIDGRASDIHIEPLDSETRVRYRIDGVLHTTLTLPKYIHASVISRIKVMANLKLDETRIPQDGRIRMQFQGRDVDFRISTLPLLDNEKIVMRILDTSKKAPTFEGLGFKGRSLQVMMSAVSKPHGIFLVTGPTGSGKSTTLFASLCLLNKEGINIVTLEDPIEYFVKGVNQSQIRPEVGLTFASGLRSILRQDPDAIMVGEIRDQETAELAVHAGLTGHLVLSTLHTNDAVGAIPRLIDMHVEPFLLSSTINAVVAQRLARKICDNCRQKVEVPPEVKAEIESIIKDMPSQSWYEGLSPSSPLVFYKGAGCAKCADKGTSGRVALAEIIEITDNFRKIIAAGNDIDATKEELKAQGYITMKQDGVLKSLLGLVSVEDVLLASKVGA